MKALRFGAIVFGTHLAFSACFVSAESSDGDDGPGGNGGSHDGTGGGSSGSGGDGGGDPADASTGGSSGQDAATLDGGAAPDARGSDGSQSVTSRVARIEGATFHEGDPPETSTQFDGEQIQSVSAGSAVTNGGTVTIRITVPSPGDTVDFIVVISGDNGYFVAPVSDADGDGIFELEVTLNNDVDLSTLTVRIAPADSEGRAGEYQDADFEVVETGEGDVKVTLSFDQDTDLDLHVVEPDGTEISYLNRTSATGGELDLDSNAACAIDGTNIENVFWPEGMAPVGQYVVSVVNYEDCVSVPVNYVVTVTNGDDVQIFRGTFEAGTDGEEREVTRFTH